ncbi:hypothetical protein MTO96_025212 [Rhipicephalus appendiculatus]
MEETCFFLRGRNIVLFKWKVLMCSAISKCSPTLTYGISRISDVPSSTPDIRDFDKWDQQDMDEKRIQGDDGLGEMGVRRRHFRIFSSRDSSLRMRQALAKVPRSSHQAAPDTVNSLKRLNHFVVEKLADIEKLAKKCIN